jgi:hypothetical protein
MSIRKGTEIYKNDGKTYYKDAYEREHELKEPAAPPPPPPKKNA